MNFRKAGQFGAQILITGSSLVSQLFKRLHPFSKNSILSKEAINFVAVLIQAKCPFKPSRFQTKGVVLVFRLILAISAIGSFRQSQTAGYRHAVSRRVGGLKDRQGQVRQGARALPGAPGSSHSSPVAVGIRITGRRASRFRRATEIREKEKNRIADIDLAIRVAVASPEYEKRRIARRLIGPDLTNPLFMVDKRICCGGVTTHRMKAKRAFTSPRSRSVNSSSSGEIRVRSRVESSGSLPTKRAAAKHDESRDCGAGGVGEKRGSGPGSAAANGCHLGHRRQAFAVR